MRTYRLTLTWRGERLIFVCKADNLSHAKEQARNAYPYCRNLREL